MDEITAFILSAWTSTIPLVQGILIILAGWLAAYIIRSLIFGILVLFRFDHFADRVGLGEFLRNGLVTQRPSQLLSVFIYRIVLLITFLVASRTFNIEAVNLITDNILLSLPAVFAAVFILIIGLVIVGFLGNVLDTILRNTTVSHARSLVTGFKVIGYGVIFLLASDQLGFGESLLSTLLLIAFGAVALGLAIAFGLGSADLAKKFMERFLKKLDKNKSEEKDEHPEE